MKPAEAQLKEWESQPGFYSVLLAVVANHAVDLNVRWLATLCVKNGVDRYWRKTATNAIPDEEKTVLRQRLLHTLNEPVQQVCVGDIYISIYNCYKQLWKLTWSMCYIMLVLPRINGQLN